LRIIELQAWLIDRDQDCVTSQVSTLDRIRICHSLDYEAILPQRQSLCCYSNIFSYRIYRVGQKI